MGKVYLLLGGNLGNRETIIIDAIHELILQIGEVILESSFYETKAWGNLNQPNFLNKAVVLNTEKTAAEILINTQHIEQKLGRRREEHWGARTIDIDILFYDQLIINTDDLKVPHPLINIRRFVLVPLLEIIPEFIHPIWNKSIKELYLICEDKLEVNKFIIGV